ncbi:UNKNOWN [Stylonychia lemnae]|uniref:Uncharacterized protein n=1 Tax=Stylonychia lemnae TaxID=5949 RepID=A0A078A132_STYLE|nr:UNKNOWN [Stylonychia lemnae]|eukprot:CDW75936.1 UNKNOWN [Stylonychia lemnae]
MRKISALVLSLSAICAINLAQYQAKEQSLLNFDQVEEEVVTTNLAEVSTQEVAQSEVVVEEESTNSTETSNDRVRSTYQYEPTSDDFNQREAVQLRSSRRRRRLDYGYYSYTYGFFNSTDIACRNITCQFCCDKGSCVTEARCQEMILMNQMSKNWLALLFVLVFFFVLVFILNQFKKRQHLEFMHKIHQESQAKGHHQDTHGPNKID